MVRMADNIGSFWGRQVHGFLSAVSPRYRMAETKANEERQRSETRRRQRDALEQANNRLRDRLTHAKRILNSAHYDGASKDRLYGDWMASNLSPNDGLERERDTLIDRSEDLYRNNPIAAAAINGRVKNVVGKGFGLQVMTEDDDSNDFIEMMWGRWSEEEEIPDKMRLAERCMGVYNECFVLISDMRRRDRSIPSLHVQVISPKRIETPSQFAGDKNVRMGVRLDPRTKKPIGYYVRRGTPNDSLDISHEYDYRTTEQMFHQFEQQFPGQVRPAPWLTPAMPRIKDLEDLLEAYLIRDQIAACYAGFVETEGSPYEMAEASADDTNSDGDLLEDMSPGTISYLKKGQKISFSTPGSTSTQLQECTFGLTRMISAAIEFPYELLAKHFDNSFSGGQLALIDGRISFELWSSQACRKIWRKVYNAFADRLANMGLMPVPFYRYAQEPWKYQAHEWTLPGWPWIDPLKDAKANQLAVQEGFKTRTQVNAETGRDDERMRRQRIRELMRDADMEKELRDYREGLGLNPDPDAPADTSQTGELDAQAA